MIFLIIYLIGFLILFYIYRKYLRKTYGDSYSWKNVFLVIFISLFSWFGVIMETILILIDKLDKHKPPKWL